MFPAFGNAISRIDSRRNLSGNELRKVLAIRCNGIVWEKQVSVRGKSMAAASAGTVNFGAHRKMEARVRDETLIYLPMSQL